MPESAVTVLFLLMNGLIWGLIIALIALGLTLIFGVMGIVNMAHGDLYMLGAVLAFYILPVFDSFWVALAAVPIIAAIVAAPMERFILRPYEGHPSVTMIATVGISFILQQVVLATYGGIPKKIAAPVDWSFNLLGVDYPGYRLIVAGIAILIIICLYLFLYRTNYGILIRASIQDRQMAAAMGINVSRVLISTFVIGSGLAAIAGVLAAPISQVFYLMGNDVVLLCFIVVIIGGMGSLGGTLIAALTICALEGVLASVLTPTQAKAAIFVVMVAVLMVRPRGLFAEREG
ncbi:branched-chain amino acid ABC transporter permease [Desulfomonile tiedjei]|uniref:Amino acid/amide ABC transporter membrane protein 1, HAAT family n=1 Tax=Desulfomonile tiedjei (strain ATCC 49306 / DSM 6799 / DCB-1) TaxID=706587 RepID=I4C818_DESTA|nr:branched-chain amino acid ABC transporter permease [Desulfomonile tiedjei]AFM25709.1 amino acid/amide ABC transporter membrane protein 1, HAAT family [Desulfomonile tiedjei DSM 6799]